jgi:hypothetical protein
VVVLFMALPFFVESAPRAYRLKAGNADPILFNIPRDIPPDRCQRQSVRRQSRSLGVQFGFCAMIG